MNRRSSLVLFASAAVAAMPAFGQDAKTDPGKFVAELAQKGIVDILEAKIPHAERTQRFRGMFKEYFDLPSIGRFVLGRFARTVSPEDQQKFDGLFEDVIVYTWARRFSEYNGQSLKVISSAPDGDGAVVKSTVVDKGGENIVVDFRLRKRPEGFKAVDVIIANVSMAITYRQEYATIFGQGGFPSLLAQLQKQVDDLKRQQLT